MATTVNRPPGFYRSRIKCSSLRFKCNRLLYLNRGLPGSAVYDLSTVRHLVKGSFDFHVAVAMNAAPAFLETGKKRSRERLQVGAFLAKTGSHLFARRAMDAPVGDAAFPVTKKEVLLGLALGSPLG